MPGLHRFVDKCGGTTEQILGIAFPEEAAQLQLFALERQHVRTRFAWLEEGIALDKEREGIKVVPDRQKMGSIDFCSNNRAGNLDRFAIR